MIGVVDGPRRQPQHLAGQRVENVQTCGFDRHGAAPSLRRLFWPDVTATMPAENLKFWRHTPIIWDILPTGIRITTVYPNEQPRRHRPQNPQSPAIRRPHHHGGTRREGRPFGLALP